MGPLAQTIARVDLRTTCTVTRSSSSCGHPHPLPHLGRDAGERRRVPRLRYGMADAGGPRPHPRSRPTRPRAVAPELRPTWVACASLRLWPIARGQLGEVDTKWPTPGTRCAGAMAAAAPPDAASSTGGHDRRRSRRCRPLCCRQDGVLDPRTAGHRRDRVGARAPTRRRRRSGATACGVATGAGRSRWRYGRNRGLLG